MSTPDLTSTSYVILGVVDWLGEATAYEIKQRIEASVRHFWPVPRSQVYAEAARLAREGLFEEHQEETGRRRRTYALTEAGRAALRAWLADVDTTPPELRDPGMLKLFFGADPGPLAAARAEHHRASERELRQYLPLAADGPAGPRRSLEAGVRFEEGFAQFWEGLRDAPED